MEISAKEQLLLDEDALLELDWKRGERENWETLDFASDEDDDLLLGEAPPSDPNCETHCRPANPDDCNHINTEKFPVTDGQRSCSSLKTQISCQLKADDCTHSSIHGRFHSFPEGEGTCGRSFTPHPLYSSPSLDKRTEEDARPTKLANIRTFQDFIFPSRSCSLIQSCKSFGGSTRTSNTIDTSDTAGRSDDKSLSSAGSSLRINRKTSSYLSSDVATVISHAAESIQSPASIVFDSTTISNRRTIKLNGSKRFRYVPVGLANSPKRATTTFKSRNWSHHEVGLFNAQCKGKNPGIYPP